jgi:F-type H+-transporting ATPase subunit a
MRITPDDEIFFQYGFVKINLTIVTTWAIMAILVLGSYLITRRLSTGRKISRWQNILEIIVINIKEQLQEAGLHRAERYLSFLGTLFVFLVFSNVLTVFPAFLYEPPTSSLSTTAALAISVFFAVPFFNIMEYGFFTYLKSYIKPIFIMLPFHIISEFSRTLALAVRLFGNMMSGTMILGILLTITPLFFPDVMIAFGLLTGTVQAYIFTVLATVFIGAAAHE